MKKYIVKISFIILFLFISFFGFSCGTYINQNTGKSERYSCSNYEFSAALIEMVDAETNGEVSGDTHFDSNEENEIFYSYNRYDSKQEAFNELEKDKTKAKKILKESVLKNKDGNEIGKKVVIYVVKKGTAGIYKNYYLLWTKDSMLYSIRSESLSGIEEMEKECKF